MCLLSWFQSVRMAFSCGELLCVFGRGSSHQSVRIAFSCEELLCVFGRGSSL